MMCLKFQKNFKIKVFLLDDREFRLSYKGSQKCEKIILDVAKFIKLREFEYFSFRFYDSDNQFIWVDLQNSILSQFKSLVEDLSEITLYFHVKHYIPDPCKLNDELTRYLYYLQLRKDILSGKITLQFDHAVDLFSFFLQSELGDFNSIGDSYGYASEFEFMPNQSVELEKSAEAKHIKLKGMMQEEAEMSFLNKIKWVDSYGVDLYLVKGEDDADYELGINPTGICLYQNNVKLDSYFWPRIKNFNYKLNKFIITLIDKNNEEKTLSYILRTKSSCKNLYQTCEDHLKFFKIKTVYREPAKINTTNAMNKKSAKSNREVGTKSNFDRVPAKRNKRRLNDYSNIDDSQNKEENVENIISEDGNLIFLKKEENTNEVSEKENLTSPAVSTKSTRSRQVSKTRQESTSEGENAQRRTNGRNRSRNRRSGVISAEDTNQAHVQDSDSDHGLIIKRQVFKSESKLSGQGVHRSSSNRGSHRKKQRSHSRGSHKGSNHNLEWTQIVNHKYNGSSKSRKSLSSQKSGSNIVYKEKKSRYDPSETCHETTMDEMDPNEIERKRQVRRRKRSKSPGNVSKPPEEILQHINYNRVESSGMAPEQLKEIPFVKIETCAPPFRISPHHKQRRYSPHRRKSYDFPETKSNGTAQMKNLNDECDYVMINVATKQSAVSMGSAINSKLTQFSEPISNGLSADSGCEDMSSKLDLIKQI
ncbi:Band 4 [Brachionus plicatilis]|uniref:Band 4 n=1 Tax=Brachionus plicatilis TaxID=10195 RepID=A0A3M7SSK9_BRAPC|nr:Band 4 [Brachionus plicatilis]